MAQLITNQASIAYEYNGQTATSVSNVATATLNEALRVEKTSLQDVYRAGEAITYSVTLENSGSSALSGITVTDDLGSYTLGTITVTPLVYTAPAILLIDGVYSGAITPTEIADASVTFTLPALAAGSQAQILYRATVGTAAPLAVGSTITNTVQLSGAGITTAVSDSETITVGEYADVTVSKSMSPANVQDGDALTYSFTVNNYGNTAAENIVLRDAFDPAPENITLQYNGVTQSADTYTYADGVLTFPSASAGPMLSLPAATLTQDATTGVVTIEPSSLVVSVTGVI